MAEFLLKLIIFFALRLLKAVQSSVGEVNNGLSTKPWAGASVVETGHSWFLGHWNDLEANRNHCAQGCFENVRTSAS